MSRKKKLSKTEKRLETLQAKAKIKKEMIIEELTKYPIISIACARTGIGRSTYYEWLEEDDEFAEQVDKALKAGNGFINDLAESQVIKGIQESHTAFTIFWLKNKHPDFCEKVRHDYRIRMEHENAMTLTDEEREAISQAMVRIGLANILKREGEIAIDFDKMKKELPEAEKILAARDLSREEKDKKDRKQHAETLGVPPEEFEEQEETLAKAKAEKRKYKGVILKDFFKKMEEKKEAERKRLEGFKKD